MHIYFFHDLCGDILIVLCFIFSNEAIFFMRKTVFFNSDIRKESLAVIESYLKIILLENNFIKA